MRALTTDEHAVRATRTNTSLAPYPSLHSSTLTGSLQFIATMLGSATSGTLSRFPCHPIDTVKARLQVETSRLGAASRGGSSILGTLRSILSAEGVRGLYRGFPIAIIGSGPASCLYFSTYEAGKDGLPRALPILSSYPATAHFMSGLLAEAVSCLLWVPIDVVKERMQVQQRGSSGVYYVNTRDAMTQIWRYEGLSGLYKGYGATIASFGPFSALYFTFYEQLKHAAQQHLDVAPSASLPLPWQVATACAAGAGASFITSPLDLAKLRLQVQRGLDANSAAAAAAAAGGTQQQLPHAQHGSPFHYRGMLHGLRSIATTEGVAALFRGASARMAFHAPSTAITMTLFENCRDAYRRLLRVSEGA